MILLGIKSPHHTRNVPFVPGIWPQVRTERTEHRFHRVQDLSSIFVKRIICEIFEPYGFSILIKRNSKNRKK